MERYKPIIKEELSYVIHGEEINHDDDSFYELDDIEDYLTYDYSEGALFFDDEVTGIRHFYDGDENEFYYYDMKDGEYVIEYEDEYVESFSVDKPDPEPGYEIKRTKKAQKGGKVVRGWEKIKKNPSKKKVKLSKSELKLRAKKAARTKAKDTQGKKRAIKKAKKTKKLNKSG